MRKINKYELQIQRLEVVRQIEKRLEDEIDYVSRTYDDDGTKRTKKEDEFDEYDWVRSQALNDILLSLDKLLK